MERGGYRTEFARGGITEALRMDVQAFLWSLLVEHVLYTAGLRGQDLNKRNIEWIDGFEFLKD